MPSPELVNQVKQFTKDTPRTVDELAKLCDVSRTAIYDVITQINETDGSLRRLKNKYERNVYYKSGSPVRDLRGLEKPPPRKYNFKGTELLLTEFTIGLGHSESNSAKGLVATAAALEHFIFRQFALEHPKVIEQYEEEHGVTIDISPPAAICRETVGLWASHYKQLGMLLTKIFNSDIWDKDDESENNHHLTGYGHNSPVDKKEFERYLSNSKHYKKTILGMRETKVRVTEDIPDEDWEELD